MEDIVFMNIIDHLAKNKDKYFDKHEGYSMTAGLIRLPELIEYFENAIEEKDQKRFLSELLVEDFYNSYFNFKELFFIKDRICTIHTFISNKLDTFEIGFVYNFYIPLNTMLKIENPEPVEIALKDKKNKNTFLIATPSIDVRLKDFNSTNKKITLQVSFTASKLFRSVDLNAKIKLKNHKAILDYKTSDEKKKMLLNISDFGIFYLKEILKSCDINFRTITFRDYLKKHETLKLYAETMFGDDMNGLFYLFSKDIDLDLAIEKHLKEYQDTIKEAKVIVWQKYKEREEKELEEKIKKSETLK